jgi:hypothetical protein
MNRVHINIAGFELFISIIKDANVLLELPIRFLPWHCHYLPPPTPIISYTRIVSIPLATMASTAPTVTTAAATTTTTSTTLVRRKTFFLLRLPPPPIVVRSSISATISAGTPAVTPPATSTSTPATARTAAASTLTMTRCTIHPPVAFSRAMRLRGGG